MEKDLRIKVGRRAVLVIVRQCITALGKLLFTGNGCHDKETGVYNIPSEVLVLPMLL